jgi:heptaprenyl diphosphate synthase
MLETEIKMVQLKETIERYVLHPYLRKYIISPSIDEDKLHMLISIVERLDLSPVEKDTYVIAIMLMYIALDTHDYVSNTLEDENSMKTRQLTILAGDYYSGLYYKFLAKVCNTGMIKKLSEGVKTINEHKVTIYSKKQSHVNEVINSVKYIEFSLIGELTDYFEVTNWNEAISNFLLLKRLLKEKSQYERSGNSVVLHAIDRSSFSYDLGARRNNTQQRIIEQCEDYIDVARKKMIQGMDLIPQMNSSLMQRFIHMNTQPNLVEKTFVEEG